MGRKHTFYDSTFNRDEFDPDDDGDFEPNLVFLIMPFKGAGMDDVYSAIKDECRKLGLHTRRADEFSGSGMIIDEITALIEKAEFIGFSASQHALPVVLDRSFSSSPGSSYSDRGLGS